MRSSRWHAHGNVYLLAEQADLTPERVRAGAPGTDGIVEVLSAGDDEAEVVIWNPDGSTAELSGNGTRIAAKWLAARTGAETVQIRVRGGRTVTAHMLDGGLVETDMGEVEVSEPETVDGNTRITYTINPQASYNDGSPIDWTSFEAAWKSSNGNAMWGRKASAWEKSIHCPSPVRSRSNRAAMMANTRVTAATASECTHAGLWEGSASG